MREPLSKLSRLVDPIAAQRAKRSARIFRNGHRPLPVATTSAARSWHGSVTALISSESRGLRNMPNRKTPGLVCPTAKSGATALSSAAAHSAPSHRDVSVTRLFAGDRSAADPARPRGLRHFADSARGASSLAIGDEWGCAAWLPAAPFRASRAPRAPGLAAFCNEVGDHRHGVPAPERNGTCVSPSSGQERSIRRSWITRSQCARRAGRRAGGHVRGSHGKTKSMSTRSSSDRPPRMADPPPAGVRRPPGARRRIRSARRRTGPGGFRGSGCIPPRVASRPARPDRGLPAPSRCVRWCC